MTASSRFEMLPPRRNHAAVSAAACFPDDPVT
jgi:hypothetical protein